MGEVVEVVFEDVDHAAARSVFLELLARGKRVLSVTMDGSDADSSIDTLITRGGYESLVARIERFQTGEHEDTTAPNALLRMFNYKECAETKTDIELSFEFDGTADKAPLFAALHDLSIRLAEAHRIDTYYGGLEPAVDAETRLFTGKIVGPLQL